MAAMATGATRATQNNKNNDNKIEKKIILIVNKKKNIDIFHLFNY